jgi:hypothetical protein
MNNEQQLRDLVHETLRKMGRNLLNYQIVERVWKEQYKISYLKTFVEGGEVKSAGAPSLDRKVTMGPLAEYHRQAIFTPPSDLRADDEIKHITIKTSFRIGEDGELSELRKEKISTLVKERNELAHSIAEKFDHMTGFGCREVCLLLDEQNFRILEEIEYLNSINQIYKAAIAELKAFMETEAFMRGIE